MDRITTTVVFALLLVVSAKAQVGWQYTSGPTSGNVRSIVADSNGTLYAFVGALYKSTDDGFTWSRTAQPSTLQPSIAVGDGNGHLYIKGYGSRTSYGSPTRGEVWQSTDEGGHWNLFYRVPVNYQNVITMAAKPDGDVFVAWQVNWSGLSKPVGYISHYIASESRWEELAIDADSTSNANLVNHFTIAPDGELYVITQSGLFHSDDNGKHWKSMNKGIDSFLVQDVAVAPDGTMYLTIGGFNSHGYLDSVFRSVDHGANWQPTLALDSYEFSNVAFTLSGEVLAANADAVYRSTDHGVSWVVAAVAGLDPTSIGVAPNGHLFISSSSHSIYRSTDDGATWRVSIYGINDGVVGALHVTLRGEVSALVTNSSALIYSSTDRGDSWSPLNIPNILSSSGLPLCMDIINDSTMFIGTRYGVFKTMDRGASWTLNKKGLPEGDHAVTLLMHDATDTMFAGTYQGLFTSTDQGSTWQRLALPNMPVWAIAKGPGRLLTVSMTETDGPLHFSNDAGATWRSSQDIPKAKTIVSIAVGGDGAIYAAGWEQEYVDKTTFNVYSMYRSTNMGYDWHSVDMPDTLWQVKAMVAGPDGAVYVGTIGGKGCYRLDDGGKTWTPVNGGLDSESVTSLAFDSTGYLYAGTSGHGVVRTFVEYKPSDVPVKSSSDEVSLSVFPNPARDIVRFALGAASQRHVTLKIYDLLGREVAALLDGVVQERSIQWRTSNVPSGIYRYVLIDGVAIKSGQLTIER